MGNCLQAAVASYFNLALEDVPHFVIFGEDWPDKLREFLHSLNYKIHSYQKGAPPTDGTHYLAFQGSTDFCHAVIWKDRHIAHDPFGTPDISIPIIGYYIINKLSQNEA